MAPTPSQRTSSEDTHWSKQRIWRRRLSWLAAARSSTAVAVSKCVQSCRCRSVVPDEHFFRRESGRLLATLTRILGVHNLALAQDVVQDTLASAVEVWTFRGVP